MRALILVVYNLLLPVLFILGFPGWLIKMLKRGGLGTGLSERFGVFSESEDFEATGVVYIHAVSVGEVFIALKLIRCWQREFPEDKFVLAPTTATGHAVAVEQSPEGVRVIYSPLDFRWITSRVLSRFEPKQIVLIESEMWPNMLDLAFRKNIPVAIANARLSERSERRYRKLHALVAPFLSMVGKVAVQEHADKLRWASVGMPEAALLVTGSIKFDQEGAAKPCKRGTFQAMLDAFGEGRPVVMAVSTHAGEEVMIASTLLDREDDSLLVVVPRHAERRGEVAADLKNLGYEVVLRSAFSKVVNARRACLVVDSTGELRDWTAHADLVLIGKSFLGYGGQNPAEAIAARVPVVAGPHMENFQPLTSMLEKQGGICVIQSGESLKMVIQQLLENDQQVMLDAAQQVLAAHQGANLRTVKWLRCPKLREIPHSM